MMHIVYHPDMEAGNYASDPAAAPGRLDTMLAALETHPEYVVVEPEPATEEDLLRAHTPRHVAQIKRDPELYRLATLAAGGAIKAAQLAWEGHPTFALIRPPGHHASADSCWGFCFFNNMSVALLKLFADHGVDRAFVLDFDLHVGDGNINILSEQAPNVEILNPRRESDEARYLEEVRETIAGLGPLDVVAASAGFDQYEKDWGGLLSTRAYRELGAQLKTLATEKAHGRRFALFEGGYYHADLGKNMVALCDGLG